MKTLFFLVIAAVITLIFLFAFSKNNNKYDTPPVINPVPKSEEYVPVPCTNKEGDIIPCKG